MKKSKLIILGVLILFLSIACPSYVMAQQFEGYWQGTFVHLLNVPNVTVEQLPDATDVGTLYDFTAIEPPYSNPPFYCLNGENLNVWEAPNEFPGELVVHNGLQGSQCTYGTWIIAQAPAPIQPQVGVGIAPAPTFAFAVGSGVNVYYDPFLSSYLYEYNGIYFNWVNNAWVYSPVYSGPWYAITPYVVIPTPLLFGPPPPVIAYRPYWSWWSVQIGPFYMTYHPLWWRRYGAYTTNYNVYVRKVVNNYYITNNFYAVGKYRMHAIIDPRHGRLIFPRGKHPFIRRGRVIFPRGVRRVRYVLPPKVGHRWLPSRIHQGPLHPRLPIAIRRHPGRIVLGAHERIPSPARPIYHRPVKTPRPPVRIYHRPPVRTYGRRNINTGHVGTFHPPVRTPRPPVKRKKKKNNHS